MKAVNLVIAILVALGVAGIAYFMASAQTTKLENKVKLLEDNLDQTKVELARARQDLAKADTSKLQEEVNELSNVLWGKIGDLNNKNAELAAAIEELKNRSIGTSVHFIPLHLQPYYQKQFGYKEGDFPIAEGIFKKIVTIPIYPALSLEDVEYVCDVIKLILD